MENAILDRPDLARRSVDRALDARRSSYEDEVRRLVEAAISCIRESGTLSPKVSELVRVSGLSNKAFYRHFRSRDELMVAVLDHGIRLLAGYLEHRMQQHGEPTARIEAWLDGVTRQALDPRAAEATRPFVLYRSMLAERFADEVRSSETRATAPLRAALAEARDGGALPGVDPERDAERIYDLAMGWLQRELSSGPGAQPADARHLIEFVLGALARPGTPAEEARHGA